MTDINTPRKLPVLHWEDEEGHHSFDDIFKRPPIDLSDCKSLKVEWSKSGGHKNAALIMFAVLGVAAVILIVIALKVTHDACVLEASQGECVTN